MIIRIKSALERQAQFGMSKVWRPYSAAVWYICSIKHVPEGLFGEFKTKILVFEVIYNLNIQENVHIYYLNETFKKLNLGFCYNLVIKKKYLLTWIYSFIFNTSAFIKQNLFFDLAEKNTASSIKFFILFYLKGFKRQEFSLTHAFSVLGIFLINT